MNINIIAGDRRKDSFMHAADMFESFKRYGEKFCIEYGSSLQNSFLSPSPKKNKPDLDFIMQLKDLMVFVFGISKPSVEHKPKCKCILTRMTKE